MGWRGVARLIESSARQAAREYQREQKLLEKRMELEAAAEEVDEYDEDIRRLISLHHSCCEESDWHKISLEIPPAKPVRSQNHEMKAKEEFEKFRPNLFHRLFNLGESVRNKLGENILKARKKDDAQYSADIEKYKESYSTWDSRQKLANGILQGISDAYKEAFETINPLREFEDFISNYDFKALNSSLAEIVLIIKGEDVVPDEKKTLRESGKLSIKKMPKREFYEIYQCHICSCALGVARNILATFPFEAVIVTMSCNLLDTQTGYIGEKPILSVYVPKATLSKLNFSRLDPSDSMKNFVCNMNFKKSNGFAPVDKIDAKNIKMG